MFTVGNILPAHISMYFALGKHSCMKLYNDSQAIAIGFNGWLGTWEKQNYKIGGRNILERSI